MQELTLYHGSTEIIDNPRPYGGALYNDFGCGLYCTLELDLAKEWACNQSSGGFANEYHLSTTGLKVLDLTKCSALQWMALLVHNRKVRLSTPRQKKSKAWLIDHYLIDLDGFDYIIGYRADDSYFSFARGFLNGDISLGQLEEAMRLGKLGLQYVIKSEEAFRHLKFIQAIPVEQELYYGFRIQRDMEAKQEYEQLLEREDEITPTIQMLMKGIKK